MKFYFLFLILFRFKLQIYEIFIYKLFWQKFNQRKKMFNDNFYLIKSKMSELFENYFQKKIVLEFYPKKFFTKITN